MHLSGLEIFRWLRWLAAEVGSSTQTIMHCSGQWPMGLGEGGLSHTSSSFQSRPQRLQFFFVAKNQNILSCIKQPESERPFLKTGEIEESFPREAFIPMPARLSSNNCTSLAATLMRQNPIFCATISAQRPLNPNSEIVSPLSCHLLLPSVSLSSFYSCSSVLKQKKDNHFVSGLTGEENLHLVYI